MGLLPAMDGVMLRSRNFSLFTNDSGRFECRPTFLRNDNKKSCAFTSCIPKRSVLMIPSAHAEGRIISGDPHIVQDLEDNDQIVFRYVCPDGSDAEYPWNPNGSI